MNESLRIADQLHRAFFGGAWHGPSVKEVLAGVTAEHAAAHPAPGVHSIWELVHHLNAWINEAAATVRGKPFESLKGDLDWPPVTATAPSDWDQMLQTLEQSENSLEEAMREFPPDKLGEGDRSYYYLVHGIAQHNLYHAGQIALLNKFKP